MSKDMCRFCLSCDNLSPIFADKKHSDEYTTVLELTTGLKCFVPCTNLIPTMHGIGMQTQVCKQTQGCTLKQSKKNIKANDGLPQQICTKCTESINKSLSFRSNARSSEIKLLNLGYKFIKNEIKIENTDIEEQNVSTETELNNENDESIDDYKDVSSLTELKTEGNGDSDNEAKVDGKIQPNKKFKEKISRKEKKDMYLNLVDGVLDPNGPVKCKICKKSVSKWSCFISHAKLHLGFKYMCEFCGKSFISSTQLKRHCRSYHGLQRELACGKCEYLALDSAQLILHERRAHTGERPYVCDACAASYHSRRCLVQHIESHRTTASVQCDQCSQRFKSRRHLARHRYSAHSRSTRTACPVCARTYSRKYMRSHIVKHHPEKVL